jgi:hypothetical protein
MIELLAGTELEGLPAAKIQLFESKGAELIESRLASIN